MVKLGFHGIFDSHDKAGLSGAQFIEELSTRKASIDHPDAVFRNHAIDGSGTASNCVLVKNESNFGWITLI